MCWIALVGKKHLPDVLENQKDRWLDSLWVLDFANKTLHHAVKDWLWSYDEFLEEKVHIEWDDFALMHHRKASIWEIHLENTHPFVWEKFILCQNWTSKELFAELKDIYKKETDSETLLCYLEETCNTLKEVVEYLNTVDDIIWTVFVVHWDKILFWTDWTRETYIEASDYIMEEASEWKEEVMATYLDAITNYKLSAKVWYANWWWMIIEYSTWLVLEQWNYDKEWNTSYYSSLHTSWTKEKKKTQITKKNLDFPYWSSSEASKKNDKERTEKTSKAWANQMIMINSWANSMIDYGMIMNDTDKDLSTQIVSSIVTADIFVEFDAWVTNDVEITLDRIKDNTHYFNALNINSYNIFVSLFKKLISQTWSYWFIYEAADTEVFNAKNIKSKLECINICPFTFTPYSSLVLRSVLKVNNKDRFKKLNLVRHIKVLNWIKVDDIILYFDALKYLLYDLKIHAFSAEFKSCQDAPFSLWAYFKLRHRSEVTRSPNIMLMSQDIPFDKSALARTFMFASWVIENQLTDLNVNADLFESTINNIIKDIEWTQIV